MKRREAVLSFIKSHIDQKGYAPTVREIGQAVGLKSSSTVQGHLERLERDGYIKRIGPRAIEIRGDVGGMD